MTVEVLQAPPGLRRMMNRTGPVAREGTALVVVADDAVAPGLAALLDELATRINEGRTDQLEALIEASLDELCSPTPAVVADARRSATARARFVEDWECLSSAEVGRRVGSSARNRANVAYHLRRDARLIGLRHRGRMIHPAFQLDGQGRPLAAIAGVLDARPTEPWRTAFWLVERDPFLGGQRPVDLLLTDPSAVVEAAHRR